MNDPVEYKVRFIKVLFPISCLHVPIKVRLEISKLIVSLFKLGTVGIHLREAPQFINPKNGINVFSLRLHML